MFDSFKEQLAKKLEEFSLRTTPVGTVACFMRGDVPDGWLAWTGSVKVYQAEYPRLYAVLNAVPSLAKGSDGSGAYVTLPDITGRVLQAGSLANVGQVLEASLPRITGQVGWISSQSGATNFSGSMYWIYEEASGVSELNLSKNGLRDISFDAARSSVFYSGNTIQPAATQTLVCIRY